MSSRPVVPPPMKVTFASAAPTTDTPSKPSTQTPRAFAQAPRSSFSNSVRRPTIPVAASPTVNNPIDDLSAVRQDFEDFVLKTLGSKIQDEESLRSQPELLFAINEEGRYQVALLNSMWSVWKGSRERYLNERPNESEAPIAAATPAPTQRASAFSKSSAPTNAATQPSAPITPTKERVAAPALAPVAARFSRPLGSQPANNGGGARSAFRKADPSENPEAVIVDTPPPFQFDPSRLSEQQLDIIHCDAPFVVGQAFAGTGKSTTGVGYAHMMKQTQPDAPILSICFNYANAQELRGKYPSNTKVLTTHALATSILTERQRQRLRQANSWGPVLIRHELAKFGHMNANYRMAATIHLVLNSFFVDTSETIDPEVHGLQAMAQLNVDPETLAKSCYLANKLWLAMCTDNVVPGMTSQVNDIPIPHNAYLKRFVMGRPQLPYHTIIFDEAQDANPIMLKLLHDQYEQGAKIILLGDTHQSIYEFNGAVNALSPDNLPDDGKVRILPLTQSWRFGPRIAHTANLILSELKGESLQVEGMAEDGVLRQGDPITYITRTNAEVLRYAVTFTESNPDATLHWVGGIDGYRIHLLSDAYHLYSNRPELIKDKQFKRFFPNWNEFERAAEVDSESRILKELVEDYQGALPQIQATLSSCETPDASSASVRVSTGHKSKGLEFDHVVMANDFKDTLDAAEGWLANRHDKEFPEQEVNLCYVLATRAKKSFTPSASMQSWIRELPYHRTQRMRNWGQGDAQDTWLALEHEGEEQDAFDRLAPPPRF